MDHESTESCRGHVQIRAGWKEMVATPDTIQAITKVHTLLKIQSYVTNSHCEDPLRVSIFADILTPHSLNLHPISEYKNLLDRILPHKMGKSKSSLKIIAIRLTYDCWESCANNNLPIWLLAAPSNIAKLNIQKKNCNSTMQYPIYKFSRLNKTNWWSRSQANPKTKYTLQNHVGSMRRTIAIGKTPRKKTCVKTKSTASK